MLKGKKKIIIIALVIVLVVIVAALYFFKKDKPLSIVENTLKIGLPASAKLEKFTYYNEGDYFNAKILVEEQSLIDLKSQLDVFFHDKTYSRQDMGEIPNFENSCSWWDLGEQDIETAYEICVSSERKWFKSSPESHEVWAFISKNENGQYYLYISY